MNDRRLDLPHKPVLLGRRVGQHRLELVHRAAELFPITETRGFFDVVKLPARHVSFTKVGNVLHGIKCDRLLHLSE